METIETKETPQSRPIQDPYVTLLFYMFTCNLFLTLGAILLASIPYYNYFGLTQTREAFLGTGCATIFFYILFFLSMSFKRIKTAMVLGSLWWISFSLFIGFLSALIYNIALIQWLLICWAQSVAMIAYIKSIKIQEYLTVCILTVASVAVWLVSIYGFVVENDWIMSGVIAGMGALLVAYNMWQVKNVKGKFDLSWDQSVLVCLQYYYPL
jgi:FtsH-binding integral membrane protein